MDPGYVTTFSVLPIKAHVVLLKYALHLKQVLTYIMLWTICFIAWHMFSLSTLITCM